MNKNKNFVTNRQLIYTGVCTIVFLGVLYTILSVRGEIEEAIGYLCEMKLSVFMVIPVIWLMYVAAGKIWQPYFSKDGVGSTGLLARIQYELNFVNTVVPFLNILAGLSYAIARLKKLGVPEGKTTGMYSFRYLITILTKWIEIAVAITALVFLRKTGNMPTWAVYLLCLVAIGIVYGASVGVVSLLRKAKVPKKFLDSPKWGERAEKLQVQLGETSQTVELAFSDRKALRRAIFWGMIYSFLEVLPFWVVAMAMGHPELLLQIIVASGVAIIAGIAIPTPMGIGGFDGAMILFLSGMGENVALVSAITLTTRVIILVGTTVTGLPFWIAGMKQIRS